MKCPPCSSHPILPWTRVYIVNTVQGWSMSSLAPSPGTKTTQPDDYIKCRKAVVRWVTALSTRASKPAHEVWIRIAPPR